MHEFVGENHLVAAIGSVRWPSNRCFENCDVTAFSVANGARTSHSQHAQPCLDMKVSGSLVATTGHDGRLVLWDCLDGGEPIVCPHPARVYTADFAPGPGAISNSAANTGFSLPFATMSNHSEIFGSPEKSSWSFLFFSAASPLGG